jgi:hypothetical protein
MKDRDAEVLTLQYSPDGENPLCRLIQPHGTIPNQLSSNGADTSPFMPSQTDTTRESGS